MKKKIVAMMMVGLMVAGTMPAYTSGAYTDEEIEKRIDAVGEEYIQFYKNGRMMDEDDADAYSNSVGWFGEMLKSATSATYETAIEEDAAVDYAAGDVYEETGAADEVGLYAPEPLEEARPFNMEEYASVDESGLQQSVAHLRTKVVPSMSSGREAALRRACGHRISQ